MKERETVETAVRACHLFEGGGGALCTGVGGLPRRGTCNYYYSDICCTFGSVT